MCGEHMKHTRVSSQSDIITAAPLTSSIPSKDSSIKALLEVFFVVVASFHVGSRIQKKYWFIIIIREKRPGLVQSSGSQTSSSSEKNDRLARHRENSKGPLIPSVLSWICNLWIFSIVPIVILSTQRTMRKRLINLYPKQYIICYFVLHVYLKEWNGLRSPLAELYRKLAAHPAEAFSGVLPTFLRLSASSQSWMGSHWALACDMVRPGARLETLRCGTTSTILSAKLIYVNSFTESCLITLFYHFSSLGSTKARKSISFFFPYCVSVYLDTEHSSGTKFSPFFYYWYIVPRCSRPFIMSFKKLHGSTKLRCPAWCDGTSRSSTPRPALVNPADVLYSFCTIQRIRIRVWITMLCTFQFCKYQKNLSERYSQYIKGFL